MRKAFRWLLIATIVIAATAALFVIISYTRRATGPESGEAANLEPSAEQAVHRSGAMHTAGQDVSEP